LAKVSEFGIELAARLAEPEGMVGVLLGLGVAALDAGDRGADPGGLALLAWIVQSCRDGAVLFGGPPQAGHVARVEGGEHLGVPRTVEDS
jgi:hypothetical protein